MRQIPWDNAINEHRAITQNIQKVMALVQCMNMYQPVRFHENKFKD